MKCMKCGGRYYRTQVCRDCGFIPLIEPEKQETRRVIKALINELPKTRQSGYINRLKEMGVL
jgi:hypothetical protein